MADIYMKNIRDWRDATLLLSFEQKGYFTEILELIYLYDDRLPDNDELICKAMPISKTLHKRLKKSLIELGVLEVKDGYYFNKRCTEELEKINTLSEKNREKSEKRWKKSRKLNGNSLNTNNTANAAGILKVKVNSESKEKTCKKDFFVMDNNFLLWRDEYPKAGNDKRAKKEFILALERIEFDKLMEATKDYAGSVDLKRPKYILASHNWLENDCWKDPLPEKDFDPIEYLRKKREDEEHEDM